MFRGSAKREALVFFRDFPCFFFLAFFQQKQGLEGQGCFGRESSLSAPKERRRRRAEKWLSKRVFLKSPFLLCPLIRLALKTPENLKGAEKKRTLQKYRLDNRFSARRLLRSFGALSENSLSSATNLVSSARNPVSSARTSVSSLWHTKKRLKGTH